VVCQKLACAVCVSVYGGVKKGLVLGGSALAAQQARVDVHRQAAIAHRLVHHGRAEPQQPTGTTTIQQQQMEFLVAQLPLFGQFSPCLGRHTAVGLGQTVMRGIAGMVIDGAVRDSAQIAALGFPVFARGLNIRGTVKHDPGVIGGAIRLGGVDIATGDVVLADADAIIVLDGSDLDAALAAALDRAARETLIMDRLRQGETTLSILGLSGGTES
jgi:hypothetical protein